MTEAPVLELRAWGVAYGERTVLSDLTVEVPRTGCTVLLGPSGTGKSTLLRTVAGYNTANPEVRTAGEALYAGAACRPGHRPALVMQNSKLLVSNVLENMVYSLPDRAALTRRMQIDAIRPLVDECGQQWLFDCLYDSVVQRPPAQQRVIAILREAVAAPELLMVDEPTAGLTRDQADEVLSVLAALARERAVLVVLHNLRETQQLARHIVLIAGGRLQEAGDAQSFFQAPASASGKHFLSSGSCPEPAIAPRESQGALPLPCVGQPVPVTAPASFPSAACGPRGFVWLLPGQLAGTPWPGIIHGADYDLQLLASVGVTRLVSLTEEPFDSRLAAPLRIQCASYPMPDMHPPSPDQAGALCREIDAMLAAGEVVAVHCRAGLGRTGTVLACYWLWRAGGSLDAVRALEDVRRLEPGWVQSQAQVSFLETFAVGLAGGSAGMRAIRETAATATRAQWARVTEGADT